MKAKELREQSDEELDARLRDLKKERLKNVNEIRKTNKNTHPEQVKMQRREIARILTIQRERKQQ